MPNSIEEVQAFDKVMSPKKTYLTTPELLKIHEETCEKARAIMAKKNSDYGASHDALRNFHWFGAFGIIVRLSDKLSRIRTFIEKLKKGEALAVIEESVEDTIDDAINYLILLKAYLRTHGAENS